MCSYIYTVIKNDACSLDLVPMNSTLNYFGKLMNNKVI